jgi:beta-glucosidase
LYPFGHGLSYTTFKYDDLKVSPAAVATGQAVAVSVKVTNTGDRAGDEVVQLYLRDMVSSVTRPLKELKDFRRITLAPGESRTVQFTITPDKLQFYNLDMKRVIEPGEFRLMVGTSSETYLTGNFHVLP